MGKIIALALIVLLVWWVLKRYRRQFGRDDRPMPGGRAEDMVRCALCGVHLPRSESLVTRGRFYCSAEHRREHAGSD
jgi:uncharacterized protein